MTGRRFQFRSVGDSGFTLIELLIVMAIIVLMVGVAAPKLAGFTNGRKVNDAARQLVSLARYARTEAISEGRGYRLNLDTSNGTFWLTAQLNGEYEAPTNEFGQKITLPDGVKLDSDIQQQQDGTYVSFNSTGRCDPAQIKLTDRAGKTITVLCASATELYHIAQAGEVGK